ncbi:hypothetical protein MAR_032696 [Mya arenaria]|uniref:Uncharacterized protein n=1 Tax=Mya arenaria TaxID=6604 RepID=A0ABY7FAS9_MYAAR|nr:hypothetical protein MAR_032696 [Mya arenaria]
MVKVGSPGPSTLGPSRKVSEYKPKTYKSDTGTHTYTGYKSQHNDMVRNNEQYKYHPPADQKPKEYKYEYKSYKPTFIGIYGEKQRERTLRPPPTPPEPRPKKRIPRTTYTCYSVPKGPDIKTGDMGPEYKVRKYQYEAYNNTVYESRGYNSDPLQGRDNRTDTNMDYNPTSQKYELTKDNYAGYRHFHFGEINDPISTKGDNESKYQPEEKPKREEKPKTEEKKKPVESKPTKAVAAVVPLKAGPRTYATTGTQMQLSGSKTGSTQTQSVNKKSAQTQSESAKTRVFGTQYEGRPTKAVAIQTNTPSPHPHAVPLVMAAPMSAKKVKTRSEGVQASETPVKTSVQGTQYDKPSQRMVNTQTSPIIFAPATTAYSRHPTPDYGRVHRESPVSRPPPRRTPSPEIAPFVVAAAAYRRSPSPKYKNRTPSPKANRKQPSPTPVKSNADSRWTPSPEMIIVAPVTAAARTSKSKTPVQSKPKQRTPTPKQPTPSPRQRTPSPSIIPAVVPIVAAPARKQPSPYKEERTPTFAKPQTPPRENTPPIRTSPKNDTQPHASSGFPYQPNKSRLPPEINSCIEAYDSAHGVSTLNTNGMYF